MCVIVEIINIAMYMISKMFIVKIKEASSLRKNELLEVAFLSITTSLFFIKNDIQIKSTVLVSLFVVIMYQIMMMIVLSKSFIKILKKSNK